MCDAPVSMETVFPEPRGHGWGLLPWLPRFVRKEDSDLIQPQRKSKVCPRITVLRLANRGHQSHRPNVHAVIILVSGSEHTFPSQLLPCVVCVNDF